jgi:cephalosporin hydroxylase
MSVSKENFRSIGLADELKNRTFHFGSVSSPLTTPFTLRPDGTLSSVGVTVDRVWSVENERLVFRDTEGCVVAAFDQFDRNGPTCTIRGEFLDGRRGERCTLTDVAEAPHQKSVVEALLSELYGGDGPLSYADMRYRDNGYPYTNLIPDVVTSVLAAVRPRFWLEVGSMVGGSAIRVADVVKSQGAATEIVCIDPFTGDVNMWAWEQTTRKANDWQFLQLERGRPTIYERFLANVVAAGHADIILPITMTSIVGIKLLRRLASERRLSTLPSVIYLDSAHEPDETLLELQHCWDLLENGGVLMGDDWDWDSVRKDVLRFVKTVRINFDEGQCLARRHGRFVEREGILLDRGQWVLVK